MSTYQLDDEQTFRDDLAMRRLERDRHREPLAAGPIRRITPRVTQGRAFMLSVDTSIVAIACPQCRETVYAPRDSDAERVDCATCDARLVTKLDLEGVVTLVDTGTGGGQ
jgi:hypothetical protein